MKKAMKIAAVGLIAFLLVPSVLLAQSNPFENPVTETAGGLLGIIKIVTNWVATFIAAIAIIMILYSAFLFLTGGGNPETQKKAKDILIYGIIGIVVAFLAFGIVRLVESFLR